MSARSLRAGLSIFRMKLYEELQYRAAALSGASISIFWVIIEITVFTIFYTYADNAAAAGFQAGLMLEQVVTYTWLAQLLVLMQFGGFGDDIHQKITSGDIGVELCRPMDLYTHWFFKVAASRLAPLAWRGGVIVLAGCLMPPAYRLGPPASWGGLFGMLVMTAGALLLNASYTMLCAALRINVGWGDGVLNMALLAGQVLSGGYLPLQLWPQFMQKFLVLQPFAGYLDLPLRFYLGSLAPKDALWAVGLQMFWCFVFILAGRLLMAKQLRCVVIQGG